MTVPPGTGAGQSFRVVMGEMPPADGTHWEFRFLRRLTASDESVVSCPLQRRNLSAWNAGYALRLHVVERRSGLRTWVSVQSCSATAMEANAPPPFLTESIAMVSGASLAQGRPPTAAVLVLTAALLVTHLQLLVLPAR